MTGPIDLGPRPPETELASGAPAWVEALEAAEAAPADMRRDALAEVVRLAPAWPDGWAALGEESTDAVEAYAYFRVGYHRGLDALRREGWRGSGYVRWSHGANRGFLRCLDGLRGAAAAIGEEDEAQRCAGFLRQLDPSWPPPERAGAGG